MTTTTSGHLWDEHRAVSVPIDQVREGEHGQFVLRLTRKRPNHAAFDAAADAVYEQLFAAFTGWLEHADGQLTQVVRLTQPRGADLLDVGKWAVEYAPVVGGGILPDRDEGSVDMFNGLTQRPPAEGRVAVTGGEVWYRIAGAQPDAIPLLTLHGGPGFSHAYLEPLEALADERSVIFYDQLGAGQSDRPADVSLWRIERFVEELGQLRAALGLERVHLLGHSWGTMLATEYILTHPPGIVSLTLASAVLSVPRQVAVANALLLTLPLQTQADIARGEATGDFDSEEYQAASMEFMQRYVCRLDIWPDSLARSIEEQNPAVYRAMQGPSEFTVTGNFKDWDRVERAHEITVPTLFTCGRYDECSPEISASYAGLIPGAELVVFEESAHMAHAEEPERYAAVLRDFLRRAEQRAS